jgi:hypothetical protein
MPRCHNLYPLTIVTKAHTRMVPITRLNMYNLDEVDISMRASFVSGKWSTERKLKHSSWHIVFKLHFPRVTASTTVEGITRASIAASAFARSALPQTHSSCRVMLLNVSRLVIITIPATAPLLLIQSRRRRCGHDQSWSSTTTVSR